MGSVQKVCKQMRDVSCRDWREKGLSKDAGENWNVKTKQVQHVPRFHRQTSRCNHNTQQLVPGFTSYDYDRDLMLD